MSDKPGVDANGLNASQVDEVKELTGQFFVTLRAYFDRLDKGDAARSQRSFDEIATLLDRTKTRMGSWSDAYEVEQHLVDVLDDRAVNVELQSRLLEAESNLKPTVAARYVKLAETIKEPEDRRALLARLVNDLQWRYTVNNVKRNYSKEITHVTSVIFMVSIALFALAVFLMRIRWTPISAGNDPRLFALAALAGGWGAAFSLLAGLKGRLDAADLNDLKLMKEKWIIWSRPLIGVGAACILYFFLMSGLLGGAAFPQLKPDQESGKGSSTAVATAPVTPPEAPQSTDVALLVVWCFIAGFSERLVPALLAKTEGEIGESSLGPGYKPGAGEPVGPLPIAGNGKTEESAKTTPPPPNGGGAGSAVLNA